MTKLLMHEDFERCYECNNPHFKEEITVTLFKEEYRTEGEKPIKSTHTIYRCSKCGFEKKI